MTRPASSAGDVVAVRFFSIRVVFGHQVTAIAGDQARFAELFHRRLPITFGDREVFTMSAGKLIKFYRGLRVNVPVLADGEPAFATDTGELFVGNAGTNVLINPAAPAPPPGASNALVILEHRLSSGSNGGSAASGTWNLRPLNSLTVDTGSNCSLASNQFTLTPGKYSVQSWSVGNHIEFHKIRLYSVTDGGDGGRIGSSQYVFGAQDVSELFCYLDIAIDTTYQIEHWAQTAQSTYGLGQPVSNGTDELFCQVMLTKIG